MNRSAILDMVFEFLFSVYVIAVVVLLWQRPVPAFIGLTVGLGFQLWYWRTTADLVTMIAAALLGAPAEAACVDYGIWTYKAPGLVLGVPIWLPLVWAYLFCLFRRMSMTTRDFLEKRPKTAKLVHILGGLIILAYGSVTIAIVRRTIAYFYLAVFVPSVVFWHKRRFVLIFIIAGLLGTFGEYICMQLGFWVYHYPILKSIGLPISLPLAWGLSGIVISRIAIFFEKKEEASAPAEKAVIHS